MGISGKSVLSFFIILMETNPFKDLAYFLHKRQLNALHLELNLKTSEYQTNIYTKY